MLYSKRRKNLGGGLRKRSTRKSYRKNRSNKLRIRGGRPTLNPFKWYKNYTQKKAAIEAEAIEAEAQKKNREIALNAEMKRRAEAHTLKIQQENNAAREARILKAQQEKIMEDERKRLAAAETFKAFVDYRTNA